MIDTKQLIEEVGRNIQAARAGDSQTANDRMARAAVVAVLKGIRVPTLGMCDAGMNSPIPYNDESLIMGPAFTAMIDALLAQIEGGSDETE
jgi:hypothetical protein